MSQQVSIATSASRTLGTLALAGLALTSLQSSLIASPMQREARAPVAADVPGRVALDPVFEVAQRLADANDAQLAAFRMRWADLPVEFQRRMVLAVRDLESDRSIDFLVVMLDSRDEGVRNLVGDVLRGETDQRLPASRELWQRWLDSEKTWLRVRGAVVLEDLRSADEARVVQATREVEVHRIQKRAFAGELERNLGRRSPAIRSMTAHALGELRDMGSRTALRGATGDRAPAVRREAEKALRRLEPDVR